MTRIKIRDLPKDRKVSREEMRKIFGGVLSVDHTSLHTGYYLGTDPYALSDPSPQIPTQIAELFGGTSEWSGRRK